MKFVPVICSTGMLHPLKNLTLLQENTSRTFTTLTAEEVTDASHSGDWKAESHSLILKSSKHIGHFRLNGEHHNTKELKNGGWEKPSKGWTFYQMKFFGERKKPSLTVWAQKKNPGSRSFKKRLKPWSVTKTLNTQQQSIHTTHLQQRKPIISDKSSLKFTELKDKPWFLIIGCQSGIKPELWLQVMLIHQPEPLQCTTKSEIKSPEEKMVFDVYFLVYISNNILKKKNWNKV